MDVYSEGRLAPGRSHVTNLILDVFRLNGALLAAGDSLVGDLGLTSARWQVLGAIAYAPVPLPVAHLARTMGLTRQAVQRTVDEMRVDDLVRTELNPHHRRAVLILMTNKGQAAFRAASERQARWAANLAAGLSPASIDAATLVLRRLRLRLEGQEADTATNHHPKEHA